MLLLPHDQDVGTPERIGAGMSQLRYTANTRFGPGGRISTLLGCMLVFTLVASIWQPTAVHAASAPLLQIAAPQYVDVDEPILVTVSLNSGVAVGGYQAALSFEPEEWGASFQ